MRCEHCGRNEATFHYQSTVNGYTEEAHLCADCAAALGYRERLGMAEPLSDAFEGVFSLLPGVFGGFGGFGGFPGETRLTPAARRTLQLAGAPDEPYCGAESLLDGAEERALRRERERNALRFRLKEAVEAEDYEQAARLRDELKQLEERS